MMISAWLSTPPPPPAPSYKGPPASSAYIFTAIAGVLLALYQLQTKHTSSLPRFLPPAGSEKRAYELWVLKYSVVWMGVFGIVIAFQIYESLDALGYFMLCGGLALPLLLQPLVSRPAPHAARAQLWIAVFGFIGNYWYTHYFYCVLRAKYTMPAWRLNDVPIAMYSATHFYFSSYHVFANLPLRHVRTAYAPGVMRHVLEIALVLAMSYATAFMETLTISNFPYYDFEVAAAPPTHPPTRTYTCTTARWVLRAHDVNPPLLVSRPRTATWLTRSARPFTVSTLWSPSPCTCG